MFTGIIVQLVRPGGVATKLIRLSRGNLLTPLPSHYAESAVATLGVDAVTKGYWSDIPIVVMLKIWVRVSYCWGFLELSRKHLQKHWLKKL